MAGEGASTRVGCIVLYNCAEHKFPMKILFYFFLHCWMHQTVLENELYIPYTCWMLPPCCTKWTLLWSWLRNIPFLGGGGTVWKHTAHVRAHAHTHVQLQSDVVLIIILIITKAGIYYLFIVCWASCSGTLALTCTKALSKDYYLPHVKIEKIS